MSAVAPPALIIFERSDRWAASLRRHGLVERCGLVETRSLAELDDTLRAYPQALVALELTAANAAGVIEWLLARPHRPCTEAVFILAERDMRDHELLCREAGAVHFVASELELFSLRPLLNRYLSETSFAKLDVEDLSLAEQIFARLPWQS